MSINQENYTHIVSELGENVQLVAVSKTKPVEDIQALYNLKHRDFGENYVQEMTEKHSQLPRDIRWHFIGHLQSNKVKYIAPFVYMIQGVDSLKLSYEIDKQAARNQRNIQCLLQVHIAMEESKFGFSEEELMESIRFMEENRLAGRLQNTTIAGLMGMASFTEDKDKVRKEFHSLKTIFDKVRQIVKNENFSVLSMGMSSDYRMAIEEGSNMVRIGSLIFGERTAAK